MPLLTPQTRCLLLYSYLYRQLGMPVFYFRITFRKLTPLLDQWDFLSPVSTMVIAHTSIVHVFIGLVK